MSKLRKVSGENCIKILCKYFGFTKIRQRGSHVVLKKEVNGKVIGTVIPIHKSLKFGTLKGYLKLGKVNLKEFKKYL